MRRRNVTAHRLRTYRVPGERVGDLAQRLGERGQWLGLDASAEVFLDHPVLRLSARGQSLVIRFGMDKAYGQLRLDGSEPAASPSSYVYAAGPLERFLRTVGFRPIFRMVILRNTYRVAGTSVQLLHVDPLGWYCEVRGSTRPGADLERSLGLTDLAEESRSFGEVARAAAPALDRRTSGRRQSERRSPGGVGVELERRRGINRRRHSRRRVLGVDNSL
jgi:adenylate cyclase class IV